MKNYFTPNTIICKKIKQQDVKKLEPSYTGGRKECQMVQVENSGNCGKQFDVSSKS